MNNHRPIRIAHRARAAFGVLLVSGFLNVSFSQTDEGFQGVVGRTLPESQAHWPEEPSAPAGAPNIVIWLIDDAGFAHLGPYGSRIDTPTVDALAESGLVFSDFHSVPLCSPARAALLAGRNHHSVAMGSHVMSPAGFPGYTGRIPKTAVSIAGILQRQGYATFALGKWDQTPPTEVTTSGPYHRWPSGQGFDRFYGFFGGDAHHFSPNLWQDRTPINPGAGRDDYFLTTDLADQAIRMINQLRSSNDRPFFLYWATGAVHSPHQAPRDYIDKYAGRFNAGWDADREAILKAQIEHGVVPKGTQLSARNEAIVAWDDVPERERPLYSRQMAAFAGQLDHTDHEFGRIVEHIRQLGELDNTIVIVTSDNGTSAEGGMAGLHNEAISFNSQEATFESNLAFLDEWGGPNTVNHFHAGWAVAGNTPFPFFKHQVDGGGTHVPLVIYWPERIKKPGVRSQYHHIIDIAPTLLDAVGVEVPEIIDGATQQPMDGMSMAYTFDEPSAPDRRTTQYYEIWGNRGIYKDGWKAATIHNNIMPWQVPTPGALAEDVWRLYHVAEDFSQSRDLAAERPEKLKELQAAWELEAQRFGVYPIDPDRRTRMVATMNRSARQTNRFEYQQAGAQRIPETLSPPVKNRSHTITATITSDGGAEVEGVIAAAGGITGGYSLYVAQGRPTYAYNLYNQRHFYVRSDRVLPPGTVEVRFEFEKNEGDNGGTATIFVGGQKAGSAVLEETVRNVFSIQDGFSIGMDDGTAPTPEYDPPFSFSAAIERVVYELN